MSGTKRATIDLNAVAKAELEQMLNEARNNASILASLSNLLGQLQSLQTEIEKFLSSSTISHGFRARMENFHSLIKQFVAMFNELRSKLDQLKRLAERQDLINARNEASQLQSQIAQLTSSLQSLASKATDQLPGIEESIAAEVATGEHFARQADHQLRSELNGLLEELKLRLHPATSLNFQIVSDRANALLDRIESACHGQTPVSETLVHECQTQLSDLAREVEEVETARQKQWAIFTRLNNAFEGAGFYLATPVNMPEIDTPIRSQHVISDEHYRASVNTMVYRESLTLEMWGASGEDSTVLVKDQQCPANLDRVIEQAMRCGLSIKRVVVKDPSNPEGWSAMVLPSFTADENESDRKNTQKSELMQALKVPK